MSSSANMHTSSGDGGRHVAPVAWPLGKVPSGNTSTHCLLMPADTVERRRVRQRLARPYEDWARVRFPGCTRGLGEIVYGSTIYPPAWQLAFQAAKDWDIPSAGGAKP
jgi:hypothetical protein